MSASQRRWVPVWARDSARSRDFQRGCHPFPEPLLHGLSDQYDRLIFQSTLPNNGYSPSHVQERSHASGVSLNVCGELRLPEFRTGRWSGGKATILMPMPEAPMHEDNGMVLCEDEVRLAWKLRAMKAVSQPGGMQLPSQQQLGLSVLAANARHHSRAGLGIHNVSQRNSPPGFLESAW